MEKLGRQLRRILQGRVCVMGVGDVDHADDGFGVYVAQELSAMGVPDVIVAGVTPERHLAQVAEQGFDHLLLLDAADFGESPGSFAFLDAGEIVAAFPQVSTHRISLGVLARVLEEAGTRVWLLGAQPETLKPGQTLSPVMQQAVDIVRMLVRELKTLDDVQTASPTGKVMA